MRHAVSFLIGGLATFVALDLVPAATQQAGGSRATVAPAPAIVVTVNRARKGDRVPALKIEQVRDRKAPSPTRTVMDGCDPSFSPVASPSLAHLTGRCVV
jgi:hypothetical protein